ESMVEDPGQPVIDVSNVRLLRKLLPCKQARFLDEVLGVGSISGESVCDAVKALEPRLDQRLESLESTVHLGERRGSLPQNTNGRPKCIGGRAPRGIPAWSACRLGSDCSARAIG